MKANARGSGDPGSLAPLAMMLMWFLGLGGLVWECWFR